jgi:hypothetical protein
MSTLWIVRLYDIRNPKVCEEDADLARHHAEDTGLEPAQIQSVRYHRNLPSCFRKQAKVGDRVISLRSDTRQSEVFVSGPYLILVRDELDEHTVFLAKRPQGGREMRWRELLVRVKNTLPDLTTQKATRSLSPAHKLVIERILSDYNGTFESR